MAEKQTHIRIFASDKKALDFIMRRKRIKSQAQAVRLLLKTSLRKSLRRRK